MFNFYKTTYNPTGYTTGVVGGPITSVLVSGYIGELFPTREAPPEGYGNVYTQYRKIHVKNEYQSTSTNTTVWLSSVEHPDQIAIALEYTGNSTINSGVAAPQYIDTWYSPTTYAEGVLIGTLSPNASTGVWIKQTLTGTAKADNFASFSIKIGGVVI